MSARHDNAKTDDKRRAIDEVTKRLTEANDPISRRAKEALGIKSAEDARRHVADTAERRDKGG